MSSETIQSNINLLRKQLKELNVKILDEKNTKFHWLADEKISDIGEMFANITLAYRHIEDARMRLGKVLQAESGGVSIYDKKED